VASISAPLTDLDVGELADEDVSAEAMDAE